MVKLKDCGVWIVIDGEEVEEFGTEVQNGDTSVTSFISSITDQVCTARYFPYLIV